MRLYFITVYLIHLKKTPVSIGAFIKFKLSLAFGRCRTMLDRASFEFYFLKDLKKSLLLEQVYTFALYFAQYL